MMRLGRSVCRALIIMAMVAFVVLPSLVRAEAPAANTQPQSVQEFLKLLDQPDVQNWLKTQTSLAPASPASEGKSGNIASFLSGSLERLNERSHLIMEGAMQFGGKLQGAIARFWDELVAFGTMRALLQFLAIVVSAVVGSVLFERWSRVAASKAGHGQGLIAPASLAGAIGFTLGALLPLIVLPWSELLKQGAIIVTLALLGVRWTLFLGRIFLATLALQPKLSSGQAEAEVYATEPSASASVPDTIRPPEAALVHWHRHLVGLACYFLIGWAFVELADLFGVTGGTMLLMVYVLAFGLFALAVLAVWTRPPRPSVDLRHRLLASWLWSLCLATLLLFWFAGFHVLLWTGIFAITLPFILPFCSRFAAIVLNGQPGRATPGRVGQKILLDRGLRAVIIALAAWWLAHLLGLEASGMASGETTVDRIARGVLQGVVVILVADLLWAFARAQIEGRLQLAAEDVTRTDEEKSKASRIRTLLPILRNVLAAAIGIVAILMVLSGLGIEIGPLLAGAGVVGVAVGFGAQTVVKDVISGMFYLWDDAFRIGEYIETGKYKGTVESFSLRSVKLRHHRGPLTTVPFGDLGAVQNMSRDWSVTKFNLRVSYDTDLDKLRKVIKKVGQELAERPEYHDYILSPLKMKGVVEFGEYAIIVRVGFMTKPGEQFLIRRDAMTQIRLAFKENGIHFALPTVQVSNGEDQGDTEAAVAQMLRAKEQQRLAEAEA